MKKNQTVKIFLLICAQNSLILRRFAGYECLNLHLTVDHVLEQLGSNRIFQTGSVNFK